MNVPPGDGVSSGASVSSGRHHDWKPSETATNLPCGLNVGPWTPFVARVV
jgi:hypothetical protein